MPLSPEDLQHIAAGTLAHYEQHAQSYWEGTRDRDVGQNVTALLQNIPGPPPFDLLDCRRFRLVGSLLPSGGPAAGATALAGECVAQALSPGAQHLVIALPGCVVQETSTWPEPPSRPSDVLG